MAADNKVAADFFFPGVTGRKAHEQRGRKRRQRHSEQILSGISANKFSPSRWIIALTAARFVPLL